MPSDSKSRIHKNKFNFIVQSAIFILIFSILFLLPCIYHRSWMEKFPLLLLFRFSFLSVFQHDFRFNCWKTIRRNRSQKSRANMGEWPNKERLNKETLPHRMDIWGLCSKVNFKLNGELTKIDQWYIIYTVYQTRKRTPPPSK